MTANIGSSCPPFGDIVKQEKPITPGGGNTGELSSKLIAAVHSLGVTLKDPVMTLSFMALPVIPSLKLTDGGLVDVGTFEHVGLFVE